MAEVFHLHEQVNSDIQLIATVTEHGTSRAETETGKSHITNKAYNLKFADDNKHFQPGLPYHGRLRATDTLISLRGEVVKICYNIAVDKIWNIKDVSQCSTFTFGHDDTIYFTILPVKNNVLQIKLYVSRTDIKSYAINLFY